MNDLEACAHMSVEVTGVYKRLGHTSVLRGVTFSMTAGAVVAVVGNNGCGKSTLLRLLSGQLQPDAGSITLCGKRLRRVGADARSHLAYLPDTTDAFLELTPLEYLHLCYGLRRVKPGALEAEYESRWDIAQFGPRSMGALSFGQRKRVGLAACLGGDPDVLILDEPTNGLDAAACEQLTEVVRARKQRGKITIAASHDARAIQVWQPQVLRLVDGTVEGTGE